MTSIVHLITGLGVGGAEAMLAKLLSQIDRRRFPSTVISMMLPGALAPRIASLGVEVRTLGLERALPDPFAIPRLVGMLRVLRPAILQTWMYHSDVLGLIAARAARVPKVAWNIRCSDLDMPNANRRLRLVFSAHAWLSRFADVAIANSAAGLSYHEAHGHRPKRWALIRNGFDLLRFRQDQEARKKGRAELDIQPDQLVIGMVARYDEFKDHATFIAAAARLHERHPRAVFVLAGRGLTLENKVIAEQLRDADLIANTRLLGEHSDPARLLPCFDIATLCSLTEGFPNAVGEAMSAELPCVASDVGDSRDLLGDTGLAVPPRDPYAVAEAWEKLIALGEDGRRRLGARARARIAERFSLESVVASYEALYESLVASGAGTE